MASLNQCNFIGNLGRDPETRYMPNGEAVTNFTIACSETWKDKATGEKKESTEWVRLVVYGKLAEVAGQYLRKGSQVFVTAKCKTRKWTDKDQIERYTTEFIVNEMKMLGGRPAEDGSAPAQRPDPAASAPPAARPTASGAVPPGAMDDDIPF